MEPAIVEQVINDLFPRHPRLVVVVPFCTEGPDLVSRARVGKGKAFSYVTPFRHSPDVTFFTFVCQSKNMKMSKETRVM
jgi:hypothetical protein